MEDIVANDVRGCSFHVFFFFFFFLEDNIGNLVLLPRATKGDCSEMKELTSLEANSFLLTVDILFWGEVGGGKMKVKTTEPRKGHFLSDIYQKRNLNKEIRTEIKTKNISFNRLIISFKRYNKSLKRYKIAWKLKQEKQNGN